MRVGIKTYDNPEFLKQFEKKVDFFEIQAIQKNDYSFLKNFSLPMVIHAEHQGWGVDVSSLKQKQVNIKAINFARKIADFVNAKKIIVHAGGRIGNSIKNTINFLNEVKDERIIVENVNNGWVGVRPEEIKKILEETNVGFCFDLNHAIKTAWDNKLDAIKFVKEFLNLKPNHFHIGGQRRELKKGFGHVSLKEFDYNWKDVLKLYPKNAEITLETTIDADEVMEDVKLFKEIVKKL